MLQPELMIVYKEFLHLANNSLTGKIPTELGGMVSARTIDLESNILVGSIPSELGNLSFLRVLKLANNALTGTVPESLDKLANLGTYQRLEVRHVYTREKKTHCRPWLSLRGAHCGRKRPRRQCWSQTLREHEGTPCGEHRLQTPM